MADNKLLENTRLYGRWLHVLFILLVYLVYMPMHRDVETPIFWIRANRREWLIAMAFPILLVARMAYGAYRQLVPDEAYYWLWSRHLAAGYLDHPPMVALLIRLGTTVAGQSELGVRWPGAVLAVGTALVMWRLARRILDPQAAVWVALILLLGPMLNVLGTIITPDTPLLFFAACNLACAVFAVNRDSRWWIGFGISLGLGLVSKYTMVLPGAAVAIALLSSPRGRREFSRPWVWLAALIAMAIFSPVIWWNARHQWASFAFQLNHGAGTNRVTPLAHLADVADFIGGQAMVYTPVLFVMGMATLISGWRRFAQLELVDRILVLTSSVPLALFAVSSLRRRPEPNWALMAYLPLTLLLVQSVFRETEKARARGAKHWLRIGLIVAGCATVVLHVPEAIWAVAPRVRERSLEQQFGWRELAERVHAVSPGTPVFCDTYENAAELTFYLPGQPQVWTLSVARPTMLDYLSGRLDPASLDEIVFVSSGSYGPASLPVPELEAFPHRTTIPFELSVLNHVVRERTIVVARR